MRSFLRTIFNVQCLLNHRDLFDRLARTKESWSPVVATGRSTRNAGGADPLSVYTFCKKESTTGDLMRNILVIGSVGPMKSERTVEPFGVLGIQGEPPPPRDGSRTGCVHILRGAERGSDATADSSLGARNKWVPNMTESAAGARRREASPGPPQRAYRARSQGYGTAASAAHAAGRSQDHGPGSCSLFLWENVPRLLAQAVPGRGARRGSRAGCVSGACEPRGVPPGPSMAPQRRAVGFGQLAGIGRVEGGEQTALCHCGSRGRTGVAAFADDTAASAGFPPLKGQIAASGETGACGEGGAVAGRASPHVR